MFPNSICLPKLREKLSMLLATTVTRSLLKSHRLQYYLAHPARMPILPHHRQNNRKQLLYPRSQLSFLLSRICHLLPTSEAVPHHLNHSNLRFSAVQLPLKITSLLPSSRFLRQDTNSSSIERHNPQIIRNHSSHYSQSPRHSYLLQ